MSQIRCMALCVHGGQHRVCRGNMSCTSLRHITCTRHAARAAEQWDMLTTVAMRPGPPYVSHSETRTTHTRHLVKVSRATGHEAVRQSLAPTERHHSSWWGRPVQSVAVPRISAAGRCLFNGASYEARNGVSLCVARRWSREDGGEMGSSIGGQGATMQGPTGRARSLMIGWAGPQTGFQAAEAPAGGTESPTAIS